LKVAVHLPDSNRPTDFPLDMHTTGNNLSMIAAFQIFM